MLSDHRHHVHYTFALSYNQDNAHSDQFHWYVVTINPPNHHHNAYAIRSCHYPCHVFCYHVLSLGHPFSPIMPSWSHTVSIRSHTHTHTWWVFTPPLHHDNTTILVAAFLHINNSASTIVSMLPVTLTTIRSLVYRLCVFRRRPESITLLTTPANTIVYPCHAPILTDYLPCARICVISAI
jgi:hypothetical protein